MCAAGLIAFALCAGPAIAEPVLEERLILTAAPASPVFQTRITRPSIRDHLRGYRVRVRQDGLAVQKRFEFGR